MTKFFESFHQKITNDKEPEEADDLSSASSRFVRWLDNHVLECRMEEEFPKMRLICVKCGEKITDEQFIVISHPSSQRIIPNRSISIPKVGVHHGGSGFKKQENAGYKGMKKLSKNENRRKKR